MSLQNLQAEFTEGLLTNTEPSGLLQPAGNMVIYRTNVTTALVNTLKNSYPLILKLIGEDCFARIASEYSHHYPSLSGDLHEYGEYFSEFVMTHPTVENLIYLPEVAQFEWACHRLYFAADHAALDLRALESVPSEDCDKLHFSLHPASCLMQCQYPLFQIIDLCKGKQQDPVNLDAGGVNLLIIRRELEIMLVPLSLAEFTFFYKLQQNDSLSNALSSALKIEPAFKLNEKLPAWINNKTIVSFYHELS